jgi:predicted RNA binding protein YcfA (HicA-like mRNA interferase family)
MVPRLTPVNCRELVRFFEAHGYKVDRQKGSHLSMVKAGSPRPIVVPMHDEVSVGVVQSCLRTAGLSRDALLDWLSKR